MTDQQHCPGCDGYNCNGIEVDAEIARLKEALREIASYVGDDESFDYTAAQMRRTAREALEL